MTGRLAALVPLRALDGAKSRLGEVLDPEERHDLVVRLLERTVAAAMAAPAVDEVIVVSQDPEVRALAAALGARSIAQAGAGLNAALDEARADAVSRGAESVLVLPADLPRVDGPAVEAIAAAAGIDTRVVVLVPDRLGRGTNALLLRPADVITFAFGGDSRAAHAGAAEAAGVRFVELESPLALDLDTPDDLLRIEALDRAAVGR